MCFQACLLCVLFAFNETKVLLQINAMLFERVPSREDRLRTNNRFGVVGEPASERVYNVSYQQTDRRQITPVPFDSSRGHEDLNTSSSLTQNLTYDVSRAFARLAERRSEPRHFSRMGPGHSVENTFERKDAARMYLGGTPDLLEKEVTFRYARPLSRGVEYCNFDKVISREQRAKNGAFAYRDPLTKNTGPLEVKHDVVECNVHGPAPWRPTSASSSRRSPSPPVSAAASRPTSALSRRPLSAQSVRPDRVALAAATAPRPSSAVSKKSTTQGSDAVQGAPTLEIDPIAAFNSSRRSLARNTSFSKAKRFLSLPR